MNLFIKRNCVLVALFIFCLQALPQQAICQDADQVEDEYDLPEQDAPSTGGSTIGSTSPWGNTNSASGTTTNSVTDPSTGKPAKGTLAKPSSTLAGGDGINPGGSPDVPFDDNMNLAFLVTGIAFSFWIIRKRMLKPASVNSK